MSFKIRTYAVQADKGCGAGRIRGHLASSLYSQQGISLDAAMLAYVLEHFYGRHKAPLVPCYPRDLLGLVVDYCHYHDKALAVTRENIGAAWENYFIHLN